MAMRPTFLNAVVAWLFIIGSACFVVGSVPAYLNVVGGVADGVTFVVGSIFFTAASLGQLLQAQTPAMTTADPSQRETPARLQLMELAPARPELGGRGHSVSGDSLLQRQHDRSADAQHDRR